MDELKRRFIELYKGSGLNQAEVGRIVGMTRGGVNGITTGKANPSLSAVKLLEIELRNRGMVPRPVGEIVKYPEHRQQGTKIHDQLEDLKRTDPQAFKSAELVIDSLHQRATANSAEAVALGKTSELDAAGVPPPPAKSPKKPATPAPTAHKPSRDEAAQKGSGGRPAPPKPPPSAHE